MNPCTTPRGEDIALPRGSRPLRTDPMIAYKQGSLATAAGKPKGYYGW